MTSQLDEPVSEGELGFLVEIEQDGPDTTIRLRGDLDVASAAVLWRRLAEVEATTTVTLEVDGLGFVDSSGLGCLFKLHRRVDDVYDHQSPVEPSAQNPSEGHGRRCVVRAVHSADDRRCGHRNTSSFQETAPGWRQRPWVRACISTLR